MRIALPLTVLILAILLQPMTAVSQEKQYWVQSLPVTGAAYPSMTKDAVGNLYIETRSGAPGVRAFSLIKYNSGGTQQWTTSYANQNMNLVIGTGVDNAQNVYVGINYLSGGSAIIKFSSIGELLWIHPLTNAGQPYCNAMTVDAAGNSYSTGFTTNSAAGPQAVTVKTNFAGVQQWVAIYVGPGFIGDGGNAITVDGSGNVYVAAMSYNKNVQTEIETLKYGPGGNTLWVAEYIGSEPSSQETPIAITVDTTSANVYVVGQNQKSEETTIGNVVAYSSSGTQLWAYEDNNSYANTRVMVDYAGNVITMGIPTSFSSFIATKYAATGSIVWTTSYNPSQGNPSSAADGALDNSGNLYVTMPVGFSPVEYCTQEYYSDGTLAWTLTYNTPANGVDYPNAIAIQNPVRRGIDFIQFPDVFVTGATTTTTGNTVDIMTVMYSRPPLTFLSTAADPLTGNAATLATPAIAQLSNYPNPFHGATAIAYTLPDDSHVTLQVYDGAGRTVATLVDEDETAGAHTISFNAGRLATGTYAYRIVAHSPQGTFTQTKQMIIQ